MSGGGTTCLNESNFNAPLPLIGIYIVVACVICMVAMGIDTIHGLLHRRIWFPCRFFPINATSLTLLSVACKLPLDLSTPMPGPQDQLTKLSGTVFICVVMAFSMPSLGVMEDPEIVSNMAALFIFVITVVVNVCIQLGTGVIYKFRAEHVIVLICMLILLGLMCSSALVIDTTNRILNSRYDSKAPMRLQKADMEYMKNDVTKLWLMVHTGSPQYVLARSVLSTLAGALTSICVLLLIQAEIRSFFTDFCIGQSSYLWANWPVLVSQTSAVLVGSVAPALRWCSASGYRKPGGVKHWFDDFRVERFWVQRLEEWKENPLPEYLRNRYVRARVHKLRNLILDICIFLQKGTVQVSKAVRLASALLVLLFRRVVYYFRSKLSATTEKALRFLRKLGLLYSAQQDQDLIEVEMDSVLDAGRGIAGLELNDYVLHLEGENDLVMWMSSSGHKDMDKWMEKGRNEKCGALLRLLSKSSVSEGFKNMRFFMNDNVPPIPTFSSDVPPNCWTLSAVTIMAVSVSLSRFYGDRIKMMVEGLSEGLELMNFVENNLDFRGLTSMRKAADIVWSTIDLKGKWLGHNLANLPVNTSTFSIGAASDVNNPSLILALQLIECLGEIGKMHVMAFENEIVSAPPRHWPPEALAGNSLYRISRTIIDYNRYETIDELLNWMEMTLADIVGACLTNLPFAIFVEYVSGKVAERERRVRNAAFVLGKSQNLHDSLRWSQLQDPDDENANVDRWRSGEANPYIIPENDNSNVHAPIEEISTELEWELLLSAQSVHL